MLWLHSIVLLQYEVYQCKNVLLAKHVYESKLPCNCDQKHTPIWSKTFHCTHKPFQGIWPIHGRKPNDWLDNDVFAIFRKVSNGWLADLSIK